MAICKTGSCSRTGGVGSLDKGRLTNGYATSGGGGIGSSRSGS